MARRDNFRVMNSYKRWRMSRPNFLEADLTPYNDEEIKLLRITLAERGGKFEEWQLKALEHSTFIDFSNIFIDVYLDFSNFIFPTNTYFTNSIMPKGMSLFGAIFCGEANFKGAKISGLHGIQTEFEDKANFDNAHLLESSGFPNSIFHDTASFDEVLFSKGARFNGTKFGRWTSFNRATFEGGSDFGRATFDGGAFFEISKFKDAIEFDNTTFSGWTVFDDALFEGESNFANCKFLDWVRFDRSTFKDLDFTDAEFYSSSSFINAQLTSETSFNKTIFKSEPPRFFGATIHESATWYDTSWPPPPKTKEDAQMYVNAYMRLKLEMDRLRHHEDELNFFALEMRARQKLYGIWRGLPIFLYALFSDYGRSFLRPFFCLLFILFGGAYFFWLSSSSAEDAIGLSFANTLGVLGLRSDFIAPDKIRSFSVILKILGALQILGGAAMLLLFGLALRNRLRMK